jgi:fermentation-respiration switch protein FrsA (DUF1100 family)
VRGTLFIVVFVAATYVALCLFALVFQKRLTFFPERRLVATPLDIGLSFEDVAVVADDGVRLHGWFVPHRESRGVVLFCHGNAGNISQRLDTLRFWYDLGLSILAFDYRGYGRSAGDISEAGTRLDARAMWRYLTETRGYAPETIVLFGRSLGAAVAIELGASVQCAGLVAESGFTTVADMARRAYPWLPVRLLMRMQFDSRARVREIAAPKLFIHSSNDEVVPFSMGRELFDAAREPKQFLTIQGAHNIGWLDSGARYTDAVRAFVASLDLP